jgi:Fic family protein
MTWNWQQPGWPTLSYDPAALEPLERQFLLGSGEVLGVLKHVGPDDQDSLKVELISEEAVKTSQIEGEVLDRDSVQSSLRYQFGLAPDDRRVAPAERGIAEMMAGPSSELPRGAEPRDHVGMAPHADER